MSAKRVLEPKEKFEIRLFRESGVSIDRCAKLYEVSEATVYRALRELRTKMGPEKLPNRQSARSHLTGHASNDSQASE